MNESAPHGPQQEHPTYRLPLYDPVAHPNPATYMAGVTTRALVEIARSPRGVWLLLRAPNSLLDVVDPSQLGRARHELHQGHLTHRPLSAGYDRVGMAGEIQFGREFGLWPDFTTRPKGDGGIDFRMKLDGLPTTVDVKTARNARNLLREEAKRRCADVQVQASYDDQQQTATLLGWATEEEMLRCPVREFGYGIRNHYKPVEELHSMQELWARWDPRDRESTGWGVLWEIARRLAAHGCAVRMAYRTTDGDATILVEAA